MIVTATEFKANVGKFLTLAAEEDIVIRRNGKTVARLTNARDEKRAAVLAMRGMLNEAEVSLKDIREQRLAEKYETHD